MVLYAYSTKSHSEAKSATEGIGFNRYSLCSLVNTCIECI